MRDVTERLHDIQEAIVQIWKYTNQGRNLFDQNELVQTWVIHYLEIIGEATQAIPQNFKDLHPEVPWRQIYGMRNILVHHYFGINLNQVWAAVEHDLPVLKSSIDSLLSSQEGTSNA